MSFDLEKLLLENLQRFHAFVASRLDSPELAEDVVQDSLIKALTKANSLQDEDKAIPWFYQILKATLLDLIRKQVSERKRDTKWAEDQARHDDYEREACRCLHGLIPTLKQEYAEVIEALDIQGQSRQNLAKRLGISIGNLKVRQHRARAQLRERLKQTCGICAKHGCMDCRCGVRRSNERNHS